MKTWIDTTYAPSTDTTYIIKYGKDSDGILCSEEVIGFYRGEPDAHWTEYYKDKGTRWDLVDCEIAYHRKRIPSHALPIYEKIAEALYEQFKDEEITSDIVADTLANAAHDLITIGNSKWIQHLLEMLDI